MKQKVSPVDSLSGAPELPPDKSIAHRAAMFAALHEGESHISNFSQADDPQSTLRCLEKLGVVIEDEGYHRICVHGVGRSGLSRPSVELNCGNSGTTMRLLSGIVAGAGIEATMVGDSSLSRRPMERIINPLSQMGANIEAERGNHAPLIIRDHQGIEPLTYELPVPSAQLKSCILLAGLFGKEATTVIETVQSRDHTERLLNLPIKTENGKRLIQSHSDIEIPEQTYTIPGDFSAASFWLVGGAIHPNAEIYMTNVGINPTRTALLDLLRQMGADITVKQKREEGREVVGDLKVVNSELNAIEITSDVVPNCIDEIPILAVAMLFADGTSYIRGAGELRYKETDRLAAMEQIFRKAGAEFEAKEDGLIIHGDPAFIPNHATFDSHHDHRIAMAAAILGLMGDRSSTIRNAEAASVSYPTFWEDLQELTLTN